MNQEKRNDHAKEARPENIHVLTAELAQLREPKRGEIVDIIVSEVFTPSNFFFQLTRDQSLLERMLNAINRLYAGHELAGSLPALHDQEFKVGSLVATKWAEDGCWYRAVITSIVSKNRVQLQFLEYGTRCQCSRDQLYTLDSVFRDWDYYMSYQAKLAGIRSFTGRWTKDASEIGRAHV